MKLNYKSTGSGLPIVLLHGLFGSLDNLSSLAKPLAESYQVIQVDLRNHGLSPWSDEMNYTLMAQDLVELFDDLQLKDITVIGHSMGGKTAMKLTEIAPDYLEQLIVLDIAPVSYSLIGHKSVFIALQQAIDSQAKDRKTLTEIMQPLLPIATIQFLLKSYKNEQWQFNFTSIYHNYPRIAGWPPIIPWHKPTLFIRGANSDYISEQYMSEINQQFPLAKVQTVEQAGHNVHVEQPQQVLQLITSWLSQ